MHQNTLLDFLISILMIGSLFYINREQIVNKMMIHLFESQEMIIIKLVLKEKNIVGYFK